MASQPASLEKDVERGKDDASLVPSEKASVDVDARETDSSSSRLGSQDFNDSDKPSTTPWTPSLLQIGPLVGLCALALAFGQKFASLAVLKASDGALVSKWGLQPTV